MTDDEISELAECLWDACAEAERGGWRISPTIKESSCCPFGALVGPELSRFPEPSDFRNITADVRAFVAACAFVAAFDGCEWGGGWSPGVFALGRRFREQALSGEGFR